MTQNATHIAAIGMLAIGVPGFLWSNRTSIVSALGKAGGLFTSNTMTPATNGVDDDTQDFQALTRLQKRFVRLKCPEGQAALQTAMSHFFHGTEGES